MPFQRSEMLYDNGYYKWTARADHDNPYYRGGTDYREINKTEGYEVLYFLNHLGQKRWTTDPSSETYQKMERILRSYVPGKSTHGAAEEFIISNWNKY
jgi:hypothetical protein